MKHYSKQYLFLYLLMLRFFTASAAADSAWTLQHCIRFAQQNNLTIKTAALDVSSSKMAYTYSRYNRLPSISLNTNSGNSFGRSINPTTNNFENTKFSSIGLSAGANVLLFGWFGQKYAVQNNQLKYQSSQSVLDQLKDDLILNVATAYLRVLLAREQTSNILYQIAVSSNNKERIKRLLASGKSNVLALSQAGTQLSADSSNYFQSLLNQDQALIDLKAILNFDMDEPLTLAGPEEVQDILKETNASEIYVLALQHVPSIKNNAYKIDIAKKDIALTRTNLYPKLNLYVSSGTNYSTSFYETLPGGERQLMPFGKQFGNNISHAVGLGLSIPLFNNLSAQQNIKAAKLNLERAQLGSEETRKKLKEEVYKACIDFELTKQKYYASGNAASNAGLAFEAANTRFENGLIAQFEYIAEKNNYLRIQNETAALKYDLYFKMLMINYFKGTFK